MRFLATALLLTATFAQADDRPLRFSVVDSWAMPLAQIENGELTGGILFELFNETARELGRTPAFHIVPRARIEQALLTHSVDVRCYVSRTWIEHEFKDYRWTAPLMLQRDLLVVRDAPAENLETLPSQSIGTVLGYHYPRLQPLLDSHWLIRDDARNQALAFELERSELERQALDARLRLLQAQVEPHFLFNTLANVRELVDSGSPQASAVLASLIAYLRAAVPRLHEGAGSVAQEFDLVRAYLEVMHMRMPDRLQFALELDPAAAPLFCPPMSVLTLVENAVRHGIDPSEQGGRIDVRAYSAEGRCRIDVVDTGLGLGTGAGAGGLGTGLANLRERLQLAFGGAARLDLAANAPRGVRATLDLPARSTT